MWLDQFYESRGVRLRLSAVRIKDDVQGRGATMLSGALLVHKLSWLIDQYETAREIKQLEFYGLGVVGMCKGQGTTDLWIPGNSSVGFPAVVQNSGRFL